MVRTPVDPFAGIDRMFVKMLRDVEAAAAALPPTAPAKRKPVEPLDTRAVGDFVQTSKRLVRG